MISMAQHLRSKYAGVRFDVVVAEGQVAAMFLGAHPGLFPGARRLRAAAAALRIDAEDGSEATLTISIGVASAIAGDTVSPLLMRADQALYRA